MKNLILFAVGVSLFIIHGRVLAAPSIPQEFCKQIKNPAFFSERIKKGKDILAFTNRGGIMNKGVCWWHSMLARNGTYLAVFRPDLPAYNETEMISLIRDLTANSAVVEIPGYKNMWDFSMHYHSEFQNILDQWQLVDGVLLSGWLRGISGEGDIPANELKAIMDDLYNRVAVLKQITYQRLQIPGIEAHAWLVTEMERTANGYSLQVLDSNYYSPYKVTYQFGQTHLREYGSVPYTSRNYLELKGYELAQQSYCQSGVTSKTVRDRKAKEKESTF